MRPVRLELHGFTTFREPVVLDFEGADLFALSGPTGAGKSSIIDGMCFALFGSVPRLGQKAVAPVISTGKNEARIRFEFTVNGRPFSAVRVVRRQGSGATTKEARLESDGQTLAGDAAAVTAAAEAILGLGFEQFTKSVVLPQGDFARFLHDTPTARQDLLIKLLELGVYERMRGEANTRKVAAESAIDILEQQLVGLADATPEAVGAAAARVDLLTGLRSEIDEASEQLDELERRRDQQQAEAQAAEAAVQTLARVTVPAGVDTLAVEVAQAENAITTAEAAADAAHADVVAAEAARDGLGDPTVVQRQLEAYAERDKLQARITEGKPKVADAEAAEVAALEAARAADEALATAAAAVEQVRRDHAAHALAATLVAGEPCPVCTQTVTALPDHDAPAALAGAEKAHAAARRERDAAHAGVAPLQAERVKRQQLLETLTEQLADYEQRLAGARPADELARSLEAITAADAALAASRQRDRAARAQVTAATAAAAGVRTRRDEAWSQIQAARDGVAAMAPPALEQNDLAQAWQTLTSWAADEAHARRGAAATAKEAAQAAAADLAALQTKLAARCEECAVVLVANARPRDAVADAIATAEAELRRLRAGLEQAQRFRLEIATHRDKADVAKELNSHLRSTNFEQWLLDEALARLAEGASEVLRELSAGQYSLGLDTQRNFLVIDHRSADERRPARTLSGGETFLASLSLALTLAEHLTQLAVGSEPRLESIFLDEGFGTLDAETLDVVATAIDELSVRGRVVGIVTHVRDLAERMPVRYEVRKGPAGSTVERVG